MRNERESKDLDLQFKVIWMVGWNKAVGLVVLYTCEIIITF